jgi:DTW domain-containing protein YfiP
VILCVRMFNSERVSSRPSGQQRELCLVCLRPKKTCICAEVISFRTRPDLEVVILQHPGERKKTVSTARMTHLCIQNSKIIFGTQFDPDRDVEALIRDSSRRCVVLFPGVDSFDLSKTDTTTIESRFFLESRILTVFVIDGTWQKAKQMMRLSPNLQRLEKISFIPQIRSQYRFRKQPDPRYVSTIEATFELLKWLDPRTDANALLKVFYSMVEKQVVFSPLIPQKSRTVG